MNLEAILDFLYFGEANVFQDHLDSFLTLAEDLKVKGLQGRSEEYDDLQPAARKPAAQGRLYVLLLSSSFSFKAISA